MSQGFERVGGVHPRPLCRGAAVRLGDCPDGLLVDAVSEHQLLVDRAVRVEDDDHVLAAQLAPSVLLNLHRLLQTLEVSTNLREVSVSGEGPF